MERGSFFILGSNRTALEAVAATASLMGYTVLTPDEPLVGEARDAAQELLDFSSGNEGHGGEMDAGGQMPLPLCIIAGGETTVTVTGSGTGGRAQEFALAAALAIDGRDDMLVFAFGTDGTDGPTEAAGAFADGTTVARARALGLDAEPSLAENDSHGFFRRLGDLLVTGAHRHECK